MSKETDKGIGDAIVPLASENGEKTEGENAEDQDHEQGDLQNEIAALREEHVFRAFSYMRMNDGETDQDSSLWLITFTDIMALMLTFFVLLYSMSVPEVEKWEEITSSINLGISRFYSPESFSGPQETISISKINQTKALDLNYLRDVLQQEIEGNDLLSGVEINVYKKYLTISMPEDLLFDLGNDRVKQDGEQVLYALAEILSNIRNRIEVIGHSDPRPIGDNNARFDSNWDLSLSRALQVSSVLSEAGYRRAVAVRGMSSARYDEIPPSVGEDRRLDLSRRVDIVVMSDDGRISRFLKFGNE